MRCDATIWPVGLRMKIVIGMSAFVAMSMHLSIILRAVSALISFLINVFFAAASEITNLLMSCEEATPAAIVSAAVATSTLRKAVFIFTLLPRNMLSEPGCGPFWHFSLSQLDCPEERLRAVRLVRATLPPGRITREFRVADAFS